MESHWSTTRDVEVRKVLLSVRDGRTSREVLANENRVSGEKMRITFGLKVRLVVAYLNRLH